MMFGCSSTMDNHRVCTRSLCSCSRHSLQGGHEPPCQAVLTTDPQSSRPTAPFTPPSLPPKLLAAQEPALHRVSAASMADLQQGSTRAGSSSSSVSTLGRLPSTQELSHRASEVLRKRYQASLATRAADTPMLEASGEGPASCEPLTAPPQEADPSEEAFKATAREGSEAREGAAAGPARALRGTGADASLGGGLNEGAEAWSEGRAGSSGSPARPCDRAQEPGQQRKAAGADAGSTGPCSPSQAGQPEAARPQGAGVVHRTGKSIGRTQGIQERSNVDVLTAMDDMWIGSHAEPYSRSTVG